VIGVYTITHALSGKVYVGSSVEIRRRWTAHASDLRRGSHRNRYLQAAWTKHGEAAFVFAVVEEVLDPSSLLAREQHWIDTLQPFGDRGYNLTPTAGSMLGMRFTDEQRARVSAGLKGKPKSAEHRANIWANREVTAEMREQMAANGRLGRGRPKPADHREKIGAAQRGSANHAAKLTEDDVRAIRARLATGERGRHLAAEFGVVESVVSLIKSGRTWRHVLPADAPIS
jgi:group I intron endonuclease